MKNDDFTTPPLARMSTEQLFKNKQVFERIKERDKAEGLEIDWIVRDLDAINVEIERRSLELI